jgi:amiloride-sensitive sodium channel subunit alpha/amiloride-sensitive sodium channel subunit gamma
MQIEKSTSDPNAAKQSEEAEKKEEEVELMKTAATITKNNKTDNKAWNRFVQLSAGSTVHGYHSIYRTRLLVIRIIWIVFFLCSVGFFGFLLIGSVRDYLKFEVKTTTRVEYESKLKFPMISFCNSKPMMTRFAYDYAIKQFLNVYGSPPPDSVLSVLYGNFTDPNEFYWFNNNLDMFNIILLMINKFADPKFNQSTQQAFGLTYAQFFNQFSMNSDPVSGDSFYWYYDATYGNCYKFNSGVTENGSKIDILEQASTGYNNGIWSVNFLDVFANQTYNFVNSYNVNTMGLKLSIDDQNSIPLYFYNMLSVKPGTCTYVKLKKTITKNLPYPYTNCQDLTNYHSVLYDKFLKLNKTYSQQVCFQLCLQKKVTDACNCSINLYPNLDNHRTCYTWGRIECFFRINPLNLDGCEKLCPLECESVKYDYSISSDKYPDQTNFVLLKTDPNIDAMFKYANVSLADASYETLSNSLACVFIYYQDFQTTTIEQTMAMSLVNKYLSISCFDFFF